MYTFAIIDDQEKDIKIMQNIIKQHCKFNHIEYKCDIYNDPCCFDFNKRYDAVFLDIEMPKKTGLSLAKEINEKNPSKIIFMTSHSDFMQVSFNVHPFHFLVKDNIEFSAISVLNLLFKELNKEVIKISTSRGDTMINIFEIYYIKIEEGITYIYTSQDKYIVWQSIRSLSQQLAVHHFVKISQSVIINMKYIKSNTDSTTTLENNHTFKITTRQRSQFFKNYKTYLIRSI